MRQLSTYSFANAKIRAMLSFLISPAQFNSMLEAKDVYEVVDELKKTSYASVLEKAFTDPLDIQLVERQIWRHDLASHRKVYELLSTRPEKEFVALLLQRYEVEQLKVVLRLWHRKQPAIIEDYLLEPLISFPIDYAKILSSQSIEEIILLLDHTPYKQALMAVREKYKERGSSFYLEAALDLDYYTRLVAGVNRFSRLDRAVAGRILGVEIDIQNINWLIRLRKYYTLGLGEMLEWFVPGGAWITKERVRSLYVSDGLGKVAESVALGPYARIKELVEEHVSVMEAFLYSFLLQEVRKALSGFPFTIGTVLGYLILKHREARNVISVLNAKYFGWEKEQIVPLLSL